MLRLCSGCILQGGKTSLSQLMKLVHRNIDVPESEVIIPPTIEPIVGHRSIAGFIDEPIWCRRKERLLTMRRATSSSSAAFCSAALFRDIDKALREELEDADHKKHGSGAEF